MAVPPAQEKEKATSSDQSVGSTYSQEGIHTSTFSNSSSEDEYEVNPPGSLKVNGRQVDRGMLLKPIQMQEDWTIEEEKEETF